MLLLALIPVLMGSGLAVQTAVNSKLRQFVKSPYLASTISFSVGTLFLLIVTMGTDVSPLISWRVVTTNPWWIWLGGLLGMISLTANLLLFPRLGSIQTAVLPIFGQIVMGALIDQFGWFSSPRLPMTGLKAVGLVLVTVGMLMATGVIGRRVGRTKTGHENPWPWRLLGIGAGLLIAAQAAINGHLGLVLKSAVHAAMISFTVGTLLLVLLVLGLRQSISPITTAIGAGRRYWWIWLGGVLGAVYVFGSAWLVPRIGTGQVVVLALFGQLFFSAVIEQFGWLESQSNRVTPLRLFGLVIMFVGVIGIHFF